MNWTCNACGQWVSAGHSCYTPMPTPIKAAPPTKDAWREAVEARLADWHMTATGRTAAEALNDLLCMEQRVAVDPAVSQAARDLVERGHADGRQEERRLLTAAYNRWLEDETAGGSDLVDLLAPFIDQDEVGAEAHAVTPTEEKE